MDLYGVLGFKEPLSSVSCETITHEFVRLANMIKPEKHNSAAAPGALKLITNAWEILGEPDTRRSYDIRAGLLAPSQPLKKRRSVVSLAQSQPVTKNTGSGGLLVSPQLMKRRDNAGFLAPSCPVMKKRGTAVSLAPSCPVMKKRGTAVSLAPSQPVTKKTGSGGLPASPQLMKRRDNAGFLTPSCPVMKKRGRAVRERVSQGVATCK
ncbi:hypothetical protein Patl1_07709 [Pistacia atlantica]|uniref:Uncharacterized protein n=1 Tax=Pistacia atlantica TaxID=434234 RepID=A0ACC1AIV7_9ROSI|nr:hypothetical protein Patl1_07709 [Pistacia atlantica]